MSFEKLKRIIDAKKSKAYDDYLKAYDDFVADGSRRRSTKDRIKSDAFWYYMGVSDLANHIYNHSDENERMDA